MAFSQALQPKQDDGHGASASHGVPVYPQLTLAPNFPAG